MEILLPRMTYTHEIVGTHGGALLPSVPLEYAPRAKSLVCIGLKAGFNCTLSRHQQCR